jgi:hypothetical protein
MPMLTNSEITANGLDMLECELGPAAHTERKFEGLFGNEPGKSNKGDSYQIRKPPLAEVNEAWPADYKSVDDGDPVTLTMDKPKSVDWVITDKEMHLDLTNFEYQVTQPAMSALAHKWNREVMALYKKTWNYVGVPETVTSASADFLQAGVVMDNNCAPRDGSRAMFLGSRGMAAAVEAFKALQNDAAKVASQYRKGMVGKDVFGFDWHMTQIVLNHLSGANTGGGLVDGADQLGATLAVDDLTALAAAYKEGDIFDLTGYRDVNPVTKDAILGYARRVVVTSDVNADATGDATIVAIAPTLVAVGGKQNVTGSIADAEAILLFGHASNYVSKTFPQGMAWPKAAIALGFVELKTPQGLDAGATKTDSKRGISMRFTRRWDQDESAWKVRYQTFGGLVPTRPEWIVRIFG